MCFKQQSCVSKEFLQLPWLLLFKRNIVIVSVWQLLRFQSWLKNKYNLSSNVRTIYICTHCRPWAANRFPSPSLLFCGCNLQLFRCIKSIISLCMSKLINTFHTIKLQHGTETGMSPGSYVTRKLFLFLLNIYNNKSYHSW